jgi:hypothetical protein
MELSEKRLEDILRFAEVAKQEGWDEGTPLARYTMAGMVGMSEYELAMAIQAIKENPDLGISVSTKRGRDPHTVVTFAGESVNDDIIEVVHRISAAKAEENFKRTVRDAATSFVAYRKSNKNRSRAREMKPYVHRLQSFLMSIHAQAVEDNDPFNIREMTERALAQVGVHFDRNHQDS